MEGEITEDNGTVRERGDGKEVNRKFHGYEVGMIIVGPPVSVYLLSRGETDKGPDGDAPSLVKWFYFSLVRVFSPHETVVLLTVFLVITGLLGGGG